MIPFIIYTYLTAQEYSDYIVSGMLILLSGLTDCIDGFVARKYNMITDLGKVLDPLADKLTQVSLVLCIAIKIPRTVIMFIIFFLKELMMLIAGIILVKKGIKLPGARWFGKIATIVFYAVMVVMVFLPNPGDAIVNGLVTTALVFMIFSFVMYIPEFFRLLKRGK